MKRSHLAPEPRTNKNGVTSVKWVKPAAQEGSTGRQIPSPALVKEQRSRPQLVSVAAQLLRLFADDERRLYDYSDKTLEGIVSVASGNKKRCEFLKRAVLTKEPESHLNDFVHLIDFLDPNGSLPPAEITANLRTVQLYDFIEPAVLGEPYPEQRSIQAEALLHVTNEMDRLSIERVIPWGVRQWSEPRDSINYIAIENETLSRMVAENPEGAQRMLDVMEAAKTVDPDIIKQVMDQDVHIALADGAL